MSVEPTAVVAIEGVSGDQIEVKEWVPSVPTKGVIVLLHGMAEHSRRYHPFAHRLQEQGWRVLTYDHLGHGQRISTLQPAGDFGSRGWQGLVDDVHRVVEARGRQGLEPTYIFGHSMGSFVAQSYMQVYGDALSGVVLCGSGYNPPWFLRLNEWALKAERLRAGRAQVSELVNKLSFDRFNQQFAPNRTAFDWLNRDEAGVDAYLIDDLCGFPCSVHTWVEFVKGMKKISRAYRRGSLGALPVMVISGEDDPIHTQNDGVLKLAKALKVAGASPLVTKLYPGARHEILHEINKEEVMSDVEEWLNNQYKKSLELNPFESVVEDG